MSENQIPKRSEVAREVTWAVEDLFPTEEAWEEAFASVKDYPEVMKTFKGHLGDDGATMLRYLKTDEDYTRRLLRLMGYANLRGDEDTANPEAQSRKGRIYSWLNQAESELAFEKIEILELTDEQLEQMMQEEPELQGYRRFFQKTRASKPHTLSEAEETLLAAAGDMADAPDDIYGSFLYADLKFPEAVDSQGEKHTLTGGTYIPLEESEDRELRCSAFENLYGTYAGFRNSLTAMLGGQVKQGIFFSRARKYGSAREAALSRNEVPVSVYDNLLQAVHDNMEPMYRYMELRKKLLGVEELHMYDIYTSLVPASSRKIPFAQAREEVLAATEIYGSEYQQVMHRAFDERWIDIYENQGKRTGAYSSFTQEHPFVLMNYKDTLDSEFTLAHELGHSMHSYFSHTYQPQVYGSYVIFVAEVASTCNEALLMQHLLGRTTDKKERAILLNYFLEQFRTTLYRQTMFAEFEKYIYDKGEAGEPLTADDLCAEYRHLNERYYGPQVVLDPGIDMEWARIPHFYYNFYVYQYATGFSAAIALSQKILREGQPAVEAYLNFLKGGCSQDPISLLKMAGVDMTTPEPVDSALKYFGTLVEEFGELMQELKG